jgi:glycosyltransferase involved in cell wall biosynthesis
MVKKKSINQKPNITIITVVKNDQDKILKTLKSVFAQTYKNFEYIVVDGKSKDKTLNILKDNKKNIDLLISQNDKNLWEAMNKGISKSKGNIIGFVNSGDIIHKNTLGLVNKYFINYKIDYLFGPVEKDRVLYRFEPEKIKYRFNIYPSHSTGFFVLKKIHHELGVYDVNLNFGADYDFIYKLLNSKSYTGKIAKKNEVFGKFDLKGYSSKIPFYKSYYYESIIRYKNGQNLFYIIILYLLKLVNKAYNQIK